MSKYINTKKKEKKKVKTEDSVYFEILLQGMEEK